MHGCVWRAGSLAVAIALFAPAGAFGTSRTVEFAQNVPIPNRVADEPSQPVANALSISRTNSPGQIRKAQIELRRLDCFQARAPPHLWAGVSLFFFKPKPAQSGRKQGAVGEDRYGDHRVTGNKII
jgi:hypothetical protein